MNVLIVEDEIIIAAELSQILLEMGYGIAGMAVNYSNAISILANEKPDIAIIDINLGGSKTGVDVGNYINENNKIPFVYLTSNIDAETIENALQTKPNAYLPKPFDRTAIFTSIALALQDKNAGSETENSDLIVNNAIFIKEKELYVKVNYDDILYFKSDNNYIDVVTENKNHIIRSTQQGLIQQLPENEFLKVHKSFIVNVKRVTAINHEMLYIGVHIIPISASFRKNLLKQLKTFN